MRIAVIGAGMMGAAAARHLAKAGHQVTLIGPEEPADKRTHQGVFASHYDEGRITRKADRRPFWAEVSTASIARYGEIEAEGGISFFTETGAMMAGPEGSPWMDAVRGTVEGLEIAHRFLDQAGLARTFPQFTFAPDMVAVYEPSGAGHISPRRLVAAQRAAAERHGATLVAEVAEHVAETSTGVAVTTTGSRIEADRAMIATGAMTDHLLGRAPALTVYARTVALFEVTEAEALRLATTPTLIPYWPDDRGPYLLPPIRYPDGVWRLKIGGDPVDRTLHSAGEIGDWFRQGGNAQVRDDLEAVFRTLMPDVAIQRTTMDACVTTFTEDGLPEIRRLSDRLTITTAGNGAGAKCSDELGRRGAAMLLGSDL